MVTLATLQGTKQKNGEDLMEYIKRFRDIAINCYDHYEEKTLVELCKGNMIMEYRLSCKTWKSHSLHSYCKKLERPLNQLNLVLAIPRNGGPRHRLWRYPLVRRRGSQT